MTRTPAQIIADTTSTPTQRIVARAYIRRLVITEDDARTLFDTALTLDVVAQQKTLDLQIFAAETTVQDLLEWRSPYGQWRRSEVVTYPVPEQHTDIADLTDHIRRSTEGHSRAELTAAIAPTAVGIGEPAELALALITARATE